MTGQFASDPEASKCHVCNSVMSFSHELNQDYCHFCWSAGQEYCYFAADPEQQQQQQQPGDQQEELDILGERDVAADADEAEFQSSCNASPAVVDPDDPDSESSYSCSPAVNQCSFIALDHASCSSTAVARSSHGLRTAAYTESSDSDQRCDLELVSIGDGCAWADDDLAGWEIVETSTDDKFSVQDGMDEAAAEHTGRCSSSTLP